jgi:hypothetical protein
MFQNISTFSFAVVGAKAPRKQLAGGTSISSPGSKDKQGGGNPVRWTPTPSWQKGTVSGVHFRKWVKHSLNIWL